jgi:hypothetical protein
MDFFGVFSYVSLVCLALNLIYLIIKTNNKNSSAFIVLANSFFLLVISNISIYQGGIFADEFNRSGNSRAFLANLASIIIFIIMICLVGVRNKRGSDSHDK